MPPVRCSWGTCNNDVRYIRETTFKVYHYNSDTKKHTLHRIVEPGNEKQISFYQFPRVVFKDKTKTVIDENHDDTIRCKEWLKACHRPHSGYGSLQLLKISYWHYICSDHFVGKELTQSYPNPMSADPYSKARDERSRVPPRERSVLPCIKRRKVDKLGDNEPSAAEALMMLSRSVDSTNNSESHNITISESVTISSCTNTPIPTHNNANISVSVDTPSHENKKEVYTGANKNVDIRMSTQEKSSITLNKPVIFDKSTPVSRKVHSKCVSTPVKKRLVWHLHKKTIGPKLKVRCPDCENVFMPPEDVVRSYSRERFVHVITKTNQSCMRYTGVPTVILLKEIFEWVKPAAQQIKLWDGKHKINIHKKRGKTRRSLTLFQEYLVTLVRIRRGYDVGHIANLFCISASQVTRVFTAWINCLYQCMQSLLIYPTKELVSQNLPKSFGKYPNTRVIIDATEFHVQKPFRPGAQKHTWSAYKNSNTLKLLVGIMPSGAITFLSKLYGGSISDLQIVNKSGFVNCLEQGDDVMADRGFNIRHLVIKKKATLNIPAFSHGKTLGSKAVKKSRAIARVRIHVERAIGRMKGFKILGGIIPIRLRYTLNQIITVVSVLCNLQKRLAL